MSYLSNLGGIPVIDDSNFSQAMQEAKQFGTGYIPRDFAAPPGTVFKSYTVWQLTGQPTWPSFFRVQWTGLGFFPLRAKSRE